MSSNAVRVPESYTIAAEVGEQASSETELAQQIFRIAPRLERVFEAMQGLNSDQRRVVLKAALELNELQGCTLLADRS